MPTPYESQLIRIFADIKNTASYFGKHSDEVFSDLADMEIDDEISFAAKRFPELS